MDERLNLLGYLYPSINVPYINDTVQHVTWKSVRSWVFLLDPGDGDIWVGGTVAWCGNRIVIAFAHFLSLIVDKVHYSDENRWFRFQMSCQLKENQELTSKYFFFIFDMAWIVLKCIGNSTKLVENTTTRVNILIVVNNLILINIIYKFYFILFSMVNIF